MLYAASESSQKFTHYTDVYRRLWNITQPLVSFDDYGICSETKYIIYVLLTNLNGAFVAIIVLFHMDQLYV